MGLALRPKIVRPRIGVRGGIAPRGVFRPGVPTPTPTGRGTVKYVELFGTIAIGVLGASLSRNIIDYEIPDGHAAELYAIGIEPDFLGVASNLLDTEIGWDSKVTGIKFLTNHLGRNALPYGNRGNRQDIRLLDYPITPGNLTPKFTDAMKIQVKLTMGAGGANLSAMYARAKVLLYEEEDCKSIWGTTISNFATLPGGVEQSLPQRIFAEYANAYTTAGTSKWEDAYSKDIKEYENVTIEHLGLLPDANTDKAKLYDHRQKTEFPEYDPYFTCRAGLNALSFGDDDDYRGIQKLPSVVASHIYTNTSMKVQVQDLGAASTVYLQLLGKYRRVS